MRLLLQRVSRAEGRGVGETVGAIGPGLAILVGVGPRDDDELGARMARRVTELRIFEDEAGQTNRSLVDVRGEALVVSQFTLYSDTRRGRRPGGHRTNPKIAHPDVLKEISKEKQGQGKPLFKPVVSGAAKHPAMRCRREACLRACSSLNARAFAPEGD